MTSEALAGAENARRLKLAAWATGPLSLIPVSALLYLLFGRYGGAEIGHLQSIPYFLQGSTDWGGSNLFAVSTAAYLVFGVLASIHLTLRLAERVPAPTFWGDLKGSLWILKLHILPFLVAGPVLSYAYDGRVIPNDFRNLYLLMGLLYGLTVVGIVVLYRRGVALPVRLSLAPALLVAWLIVGIDGNTAKAGQVLNAGVDPDWTPRSPLHAVMLGWHRLCDGVLGDVGPRE